MIINENIKLENQIVAIPMSCAVLEKFLRTVKCDKLYLCGWWHDFARTVLSEYSNLEIIMGNRGDYELPNYYNNHIEAVAFLDNQIVGLILGLETDDGR